MDHATFKKLVDAGEKDRVDFKLECGAFASQSEAEKAELAKDICAMCNNGNVKSYLLIGVSDDGQKTKSVANVKLTDDNLQSFCKTAISPAPKVDLYRFSGAGRFMGTEFVIIEIGPHPRQAFCFAKDFISYKCGYAFRRNEVWIRRGKTSDLATPQEIARLVQGKPPQEDHDTETRAARAAFSESAERERRRLTTEETDRVLQSLGYTKLPDDEAKMLAFGWGSYPTYGKRLRDVELIVRCFGCGPTLTRSALETLGMHGHFWSSLANWQDLPDHLRRRTRHRLKGIRRLSLLPVLSPVPEARISGSLADARRLGELLHYYWPELDLPYSGKPVRSSSEVLVIDRIKSVPEYGQRLIQALAAVEQSKTPLVSVRSCRANPRRQQH